MNRIKQLWAAIVNRFRLTLASLVYRMYRSAIRPGRRGDGSERVAPGVYVYRGESARKRMGRLRMAGLIFGAFGLPQPLSGGAGGHQSLFDQAKATLAVSPQLIDNTTVDGNSVDMLGWDFVDFLIAVGATDITADCTLEDSADDTTFADISGAAITQLAATDDDSLSIISLAHDEGGYNRYVRSPLTVGDGTTGAYMCSIAVQYGAHGGQAARADISQASTTNELKKV